MEETQTSLIGYIYIQQDDTYHMELALILRNIKVKHYIWAIDLHRLHRRFGEYSYIRNTWRVLKCGAGEG